MNERLWLTLLAMLEAAEYAAARVCHGNACRFLKGMECNCGLLALQARVEESRSLLREHHQPDG